MDGIIKDILYAYCVNIQANNDKNQRTSSAYCLNRNKTERLVYQ